MNTDVNMHPSSELLNQFCLKVSALLLAFIPLVSVMVIAFIVNMVNLLIW